jgi:hypothetical protein
VVATAADIGRLKTELPGVQVDWTLPDEATTAKTRQAFERHFAKPGK